jgi:hypothetical protein
VKTLNGNDPNFLTAQEFCITAMHLLTRLSVGEFSATKQITVLEHPAYSPDLAPSDHFVPEDKGNIERKAFGDDIRIRQLRRPFHKTSSKIVLKGGLGAGMCA